VIKWRKRQGVYMDEATADRLKTLEVKIDGNGGEGLLQRVSTNSKNIKQLDDRLDQLELRKVDVIKCDRQEERIRDNWDTFESKISKQVIDTINNHEKKWVRYAGPILTGLAAFLLAVEKIV